MEFELIVYCQHDIIVEFELSVFYDCSKQKLYRDIGRAMSTLFQTPQLSATSVYDLSSFYDLRLFMTLSCYSLVFNSDISPIIRAYPISIR